MARRGENIYKRKDGRWEGRYKNGYKPNGKTRYSSVYAHSYKQVRELLNEKRIQCGEEVTCCPMTINKLFESWFVSIKLDVKESTYANYLMKYEKHISPFMGQIVYDRLTADFLNYFISTKIQSGLSTRYVADIARVLKSVCHFAHRRFGLVDKSGLIPAPRCTDNEKKLLSSTEQNILNSYLLREVTPLNAGIFLAAATGIRLGELCALKWADIDPHSGTIFVSHTLQRIKNCGSGSATKLVITAPKSSSSVRRIPLPAFVISMLEKLRRSDEIFVLSACEKPLEPRTVQYAFKKILKTNRLSDVSFHSLRHAFATNCITLGVDVKTLSELLGHSSVAITLNRYVHTSMEQKTKCMERVSEIFMIS